MSSAKQPASDVSEVLRLDKAQGAVATADATKNQLVLAGPGAGKTHVVSGRLADLVARQDLRPRSEVLLLSYTRSAVREMKNRLEFIAGEMEAPHLKNAKVKTIDSFAYQVHQVSETTFPGGGYDEGIETATSLLEAHPQARMFVGELKHLIVDEAQDLTDIRERFVEGLISGVSGGYTVLGDPNQSIYDYQRYEKGEDPSTGFRSLIEYLDAKTEYLRRRLRRTYRHRGHVRELVYEATDVLEDAARTPATKLADLTDIVKGRGTDLVEAPMTKDDLLMHALDRTDDGRTAILTRTNGEALAVSSVLHDQGIPHVLKRGDHPLRVPGWVGRILPGLPERFGEANVGEAWDETLGGPVRGVPTPTEAYRILELAGRATNKPKVPKESVLNAIRYQRLWPDEHTYEAALNGRTVVSTVHKAKGREYENVLLLSPYIADEPTGWEASMEARVLYVALSRPRSAFRVFDLAFRDKVTKNIKDGDGEVLRWYRPSLNQKRPVQVELDPEDVNPFSPIFGSADKRQELLWEFFGRQGNFVSGSHRDEHSGSFSFYLSDEELGWPSLFSISSSRGGREIVQVSEADRGVPPDNLSDVWVEGLATFAGKPDRQLLQYIDRDQLDRDCWLVPIVKGYATMWSKDHRQVAE